jgi:hypothetical protein
MPPDDNARMQECNWIRSEIARQRGLAGAGAAMATNMMTVAAFQAVAQQNIAALESRAANIQCTAAFSSASNNTPATSNQAFDQCFERCQKYTERTREQCFDACNK